LFFVDIKKKRKDYAGTEEYRG